MKRGAKYLIIGLVILGLAVYAGYAYLSTHPSSAVASSSAGDTVTTATTPQNASATLLSLINAERAKAHVPALAIDPKVAASAQWKIDDMKQNNYLGYVKPGDQTQNGIQKLFELTGNECEYGNEAIVWDANKTAITPNAAVNWWMSNDSYRSMLLDKDYTKAGFGIGAYDIVAHFCQP